MLRCSDAPPHHRLRPRPPAVMTPPLLPRPTPTHCHLRLYGASSQQPCCAYVCKQVVSSITYRCLPIFCRAPHPSDFHLEAAQALQDHFALNSRAFLLDPKASAAAEEQSSGTLGRCLRRLWRAAQPCGTAGRSKAGRAVGTAAAAGSSTPPGPPAATAASISSGSSSPASAGGPGGLAVCDTVPQAGRVELVGNRTECALLLLLRAWGVDYRALRQRHDDAIQASCHGLARSSTIGIGGQWLHPAACMLVAPAGPEPAGPPFPGLEKPCNAHRRL